MKTRILHVIETGGPGGAENMFISLIGRLGERGFDPTIVLLKKAWLWEQLESRGFKPVRIESTGPLDWKLVLRLVRLIRRERIDLVHSHLLDINVYSALAARCCRVPHLATEHGDIHHVSKTSAKIAWKLRLLAMLTGRLVAVSDFTAMRARELAPAKAGKIEVIYNGIEWERYGRAPESREVRRELSVPDGVPWVLNVGNLYPVKGQIHLIRAFAGVRREVPGAVLSVVGRGALEPELRREIERLGLGGQVLLHGFRNDVNRLLGACDLFVLASLSEGLPLSVLEAMASGVPVIASDVGGVGELVREGETGLLVAARDESGLARAMTSLLTDPRRAGRIADRAGRLVRDRFSAEVMTDRYLELYERLLGGTGQSLAESNSTASCRREGSGQFGPDGAGDLRSTSTTFC